MTSDSWHYNSPFEAHNEDNELWLAAIDRLIEGSGIDGAAYDIASVKSTNTDIIADLAAGTNAVELNLNHGNCQELAQLQSILNNVHTEMIQLSLVPSAHNADLATVVFAYLNHNNKNPASIQFAINADPLGSMAYSGIDCDTHLKNAAIVAAYCAENYSNATTLCVDTSTYHNSGCSEAQELALLLASCTEYLRAMENTRALITQLAQHCGISQFTPMIDTVSSLRNMTTMDETVNILRTTTQATAAMTGGANSYYCDPYNMLSKSEGTRALRLCQNTHHVLIEEAHLLQVQDPMRGSGFIESVTDSMCEHAWQQFQHIEQQGGLSACLRSGTIAALVKETAAKRKDALANNEVSMVGVNIYPNSEDKILQTIEPTLSDPSDLIVDFTKATPAEIVESLLNGKSISEHANKQHLTQTCDPIKPARDAVPFEGRSQ